MTIDTNARSATRVKNPARYRLCGKVVKSDLRLPSLPMAGGGRPSVVIRRQREEAVPRDGGHPIYELVDSAGTLVYRLTRGDGEYLWWYPNVGRFAISADGGLIRWVARDDSLPDVTAVVAGPILGFALQLQGQVNLHGSAVVIDEQAVGLLAPSGGGKSTMAALLMSRGYRLLTDDVVSLDARSEGVRVLPGYPTLKLWPDALGHFVDDGDWRRLPRHASWLDKRVLPAADLGSVCGSARPLAALFVLSPTGPDGDVEVTRLRGKEALLALVAHGYNAHLLALEPEVLVGQLNLFSRLVGSTPVYVIRCPRALERLNEVADAVLTHAQPAYRGVL